VEITSGLKEGERVATRHVVALEEGAALDVAGEPAKEEPAKDAPAKGAPAPREPAKPPPAEDAK
jgi:hypothetical protein